jgi:Flp pilus assembly pilin Flp
LAGLTPSPIINLRPAPGKKLIWRQFWDICPVGERGARFRTNSKETQPVAKILQKLWNDESGQDIAEYAVMLAVILVIVVGTIRLIGSNANNVFSNVGSAIK